MVLMAPFQFEIFYDSSLGVLPTSAATTLSLELSVPRCRAEVEDPGGKSTSDMMRKGFPGLVCFIRVTQSQTTTTVKVRKQCQEHHDVEFFLRNHRGVCEEFFHLLDRAKCHPPPVA